MAAIKIEGGLLTLFTDTCIADIAGTKEVVTVTEGTSCAEALELLNKHKILSCPVRNADNTKTIGMFDMQDVVAVLIAILKVETKEDMIAKREEFCNLPVEKVANKSTFDVYFPVSGEMSLNHLLEEFTRGIHRIAVKESEDSDTITSIVSQSTIVRWLVKHWSEFDDSAKRPLAKSMKSLSLRATKCLKIEKDKSAYEAFKVMNKTKMDALAVIDEDGVLVANISQSDLRGITPQTFEYLFLPVEEFLIKMGGEDREKNKSLQPVTTSFDTYLKDAIAYVVKHGVHRLWICDTENKPQFQMTLTNIMKGLLIAAAQNKARRASIGPIDFAALRSRSRSAPPPRNPNFATSPPSKKKNKKKSSSKLSPPPS